MGATDSTNTICLPTASHSDAPWFRTPLPPRWGAIDRTLRGPQDTPRSVLLRMTVSSWSQLLLYGTVGMHPSPGPNRVPAKATRTAPVVMSEGVRMQG